MQERQNDVDRDESVNIWEQYVSRVNKLGSICAASYPRVGERNN